MSYNPSTNKYSPDVNSHPIYEPNGTIKIYHDVPLDSSYVHSYNNADWNTPFATAVESFRKYTLTAQSYSRLTEGSVRVEIFKGDLISCNYMQITNGINGENFPYWCFITDIEYVNNTTTDIYFQIDYLQTYWDRFTIPANFIVREHIPVSEDVIGASIVPENLGLGDLIVHHSGWRTSGTNNSMKTIIMYVPNTRNSLPYVAYDPALDSGHGDCVALPDPLPSAIEDDQLKPLVRNKFGSGIYCITIPYTNDTAVKNGINLINEHQGSVVAVFQIPFEMYADNWSTSFAEHEYTITQQTDFKYISKSGSYTNVRNKKLYSYPFRELVVSNQNGTNAELKWELFSTRSNNQVVANFNVANVFVPSPKSFVYPKNYRNLSKDYDSGITLEDFPQPCYTEDSFSKWWAQNKSSLGISLLSQIGSTGLMFATAGGSAGAGFGAEMAGVFADEGAVALENMAMANSLGMGNVGRGFGNMASTFFQAEEMAKTGGGKKGLSRGQGLALSTGALGIAKTLSGVLSARAVPNTANMQNNSAMLNVLLDRFGFVFYDVGITGEMAEIFDKYFDMFGYATNRVKVPNFLASATKRPSYNYVKMQNCYIKAQTGDRGLPEKAQSAIQAIFNNGITFWSNLSDVGNYNVTNR